MPDPTDHVIQDAEDFDGWLYHAPTPEMVPKFEAVTAAIKALRNTIHREVPASAERTLALRHLQECRMFANMAITFDGRRVEL